MENKYRAHVLVCAGAGCISSGCAAVKEALLNALSECGLRDEVRVVETGCMGPCDLGPVIMVYPEGVMYQKVKAEDARRIADEHLMKGRVVRDLLFKSPEDGEKVLPSEELPFFKKQVRIALRNTGLINPEVVEEYIARGGYTALGKVLSKMSPAEVIAVVKASGLRGRGGAGFPTGLKWQFTAKAEGYPKYVVCNADEGDPGAFMDRSILEGDPHSVIEAMAIAGYAIGSNQGFVYVRAEYPLAVARLSHAISQAREYGLIGKNIFGSGFDFDIEIRVGAGAFVCGEETALLASIEGRRGEPRPKPPFPANKGLWGKPTVINNVETFANVPPIILNGPEWFAKIGTEKSKGTKVFALAGKVKNTGLVEVPMGTPLGDIIFDIGGGIPGGKKFKAAQTGGPSGGCIPVEYLNVPVDYDSLTELGTIMGSGGLIVMDEDTCMVDLAKFFLEFVHDESCGKCAPCRIGTKRMLEILTRITRGEGREGDIELLIELGRDIKDTALCGLGQTAPNPVLSTIKYFRDEYEAHIKEKRCPASVCASLFKAPCQNSCPAGIDVPGYITLIQRGDFLSALELIRERNPFPAICGRVCNHPCERKCRRGQLDEAIDIRGLKRAVADYEMRVGERPPLRMMEPTGKKVAIIGSGPAGLTAAYYLASWGHSVTVFERLSVAGGMMAVGIPRYRLPKEVLEYEIKRIRDMGVEIRTETALGRDFTIDDLKRDGYDAIFIAIGAHKPLELGVEGQDLEGVIYGVEFLREINLGRSIPVGDKVIVVGGGNVAIDSARTALRLGASEVHILYRRERKDMTAADEEVEAALMEGVQIHYLVAPLRIVGENGAVSGIECERMTLGEFDFSGRRRPVKLPNSEFLLSADTVISAVGQRPDLAGCGEGDGFEVTRWSTLVVDASSLATKREGVYAGGDCVTGPDTVINAIAHGQKAAIAIDRELGGSGWKGFGKYREMEQVGPIIEERRARRPMACLSEGKRKATFDEVNLGFTLEEAVEEAGRCLRCDLKI